jgi:glycerol-3-phosphate dehydrogenase subunit B
VGGGRPKIGNPNLLLRDFLQERWKGLVPILWGRQLKQERLDELIYLSLMNADHLPDRELASPMSEFYVLDISEETVNSEQSAVSSEQSTPLADSQTRPLANSQLAHSQTRRDRRSPLADSQTLLIIGAGLTGLAAAYVAAKANVRVDVIAKGWGAHHWASGAVDVLGYLPGEPDEAVKRPFEALEQLAAGRPGHPYSLLGAAQLKENLDLFAAITAEIGLPYAGAQNKGDNLWLPSAVGAARPTYLAPQGQMAGDLARGEPMLIVGFQGMGDFYPYLIAENLNRQGISARAALLPLALVTDRHDFSTVHLAEGFEEPERLALIAGRLQELLQPGERIGLPAIVGIDEHPAVMAELERQTGTAVFEIPTLPPSVPGIRLFKRLRRHLLQMGVRVNAGMTVSQAQVTDNGHAATVASVQIESSARPYNQRADHFLLATGGILGGGFSSDQNGRLWETIFDLPLHGPQQRSDWFHRQFLNREGHPVFAAGVVVDEHFQPLSAAGDRLFANLWVAGNLLAHSDALQERSMEGVAIGTGIAAVKAMMELTINC